MLGKINVIFGSTASGKTAYAIELAKKLNGVVINYDSMQIYKEIPIITAQPTDEEKQGIEHRLYGYLSVHDKSSTAAWRLLALKEIESVRALGETPILVGGTGMYLKTLMDGITHIPEIPEHLVEELNSQYTASLYAQLINLDPSCQLKPNDRQRIIRALAIALHTGKSINEFHKNSNTHSTPYKRSDYHVMLLKLDRETIYKNIDLRFRKMVDSGALEETRPLAINRQSLAMLPKAHGLSTLIMYHLGDISLEDAIKQTQQQSRNYAKRQITWANNQLVFDEII